MDHEHLANSKVFRAFCDETRLAVLELLQSGEKCACVLLQEVAVGQSTLSHHMKILLESGIVNSRKEGKWTYYSISKEGAKTAARLLKQITATAVKKEKNECKDRECCK